MKKRRSPYTEQQIAQALRQVEQGAPAPEVCRMLGVSVTTCCLWKKRYAGMGVAEPRRVKQVEDENRPLKQVVANLTLDNPRTPRTTLSVASPSRAGRAGLPLGNPCLLMGPTEAGSPGRWFPSGRPTPRPPIGE